MRGLSDREFNESGEVLYLGSSLGLQVFARDSKTGSLSLAQSFDDYFRRSALLWNVHRTRLLVDDCGTWRAFAPVGDGSTHEDRGELTVAEDPGRCPEDLFMDTSGSFLYRIGDEHIDLPAFWQQPFFGGSTNICSFASLREGTLIADVFCASSAFVVEWRSLFEFLAGTDYLANTQPDRFNNHVPDFAIPEDMAASPDGRYVYLATDRHGILIFERIGGETDDSLPP